MSKQHSLAAIQKHILNDLMLHKKKVVGAPMKEYANYSIQDFTDNVSE